MGGTQENSLSFIIRRTQTDVHRIEMVDRLKQRQHVIDVAVRLCCLKPTAYIVENISISGGVILNERAESM